MGENTATKSQCPTPEDETSKPQNLTKSSKTRSSQKQWSALASRASSDTHAAALRDGSAGIRGARHDKTIAAASASSTESAIRNRLMRGRRWRQFDDARHAERRRCRCESFNTRGPPFQYYYYHDCLQQHRRRRNDGNRAGLPVSGTSTTPTPNCYRWVGRFALVSRIPLPLSGRPRHPPQHTPRHVRVCALGS